MGQHSTNYLSSLIQVAPDCPLRQGQIPPQANPPSLAWLQYEKIANAPYQFTSDEVLFACYATKQGFKEQDLAAAKVTFFSQGQPCLRASPLVKRYGWGIHSDAQGRVALVDSASAAYQTLTADPQIRQLLGMRSQRAK